MREMKNYICLLALGTLQATISHASPLTSTPSPAAFANNSLAHIPVQRFTFEEIWNDGISWIRFNHPGVELWSVTAAPTRGGSEHSGDFTYVRVEAFDALGQQLLETTNIAGGLLWGLIHTEPLTPRSGLFEPFPNERVFYTLSEILRIVTSEGYAGAWRDVAVMQWKASPIPPPEEPLYWLNRADPTPECQSVAVGAWTGRFLAINDSNDLASQFYMSAGTKSPIQPASAKL